MLRREIVNIPGVWVEDKCKCTYYPNGKPRKKVWKNLALGAGIGIIFKVYNEVGDVIHTNENEFLCHSYC